MTVPYANENVTALVSMLQAGLAWEEVPISRTWQHNQLSNVDYPLHLARIAEPWNPKVWHDLRDEGLQQARRRRAVPPRDALNYMHIQADVERARRVGERADGNEIDAAFGSGPHRVEGDAAGGLE